jgi:nicotinamide-nucleotide amidase
VLEDDRLGLCIVLPGPPHEVEAMLRESVVPFLARRVRPGLERPFRRTLRTAGIAESAIAERVGDALADLPLEVAYLPKLEGNDIRLTAWAADESEVRAVLDEGVRRLRARLGPHVYAEGDVDLAEVVGELLRARGMTLAVAESCTAGLVAKRLTDIPGSSDYFWGGMVVYDDGAKRELLGVSEATLRAHGAVSEETAREMAEGARRRSGADAAVAVTGVAGPGGGSEEKPVGTVWLAVQVAERAVSKRRHYPGARDMVRRRAAQGALDLLRRALLETAS